MTERLIAACLLLGLGLHGQAFADEPSKRFWSDARRGWHFYEEPEAELPPTTLAAPDRKAPKPSTPAAPQRAPELIEFERLQKTLEEVRNIAIMRPTEVNVRRYMELESRVVARASTFADVAQRVAWSSPELDPTLRGRPVNAKAIEVYEQQQSVERSRSIADLGRDHVLIFFFRGDCPYCHRLHYHGIPHGQSWSNQVRIAHCPTRYVRVGRGARAFYRPIRERRGEYLIGPRP